MGQMFVISFIKIPSAVFKIAR